MSIKDIVYVALAVISSLGGGGFIVLGLSSYLGKIWAEKLLAKNQLELDKELEKTKSAFLKDIENLKAELEKTKNDYYRFATKRFKIIEQTWSAVFDVTEELKIYNKNDDYSAYIEKSLKTIIKYLDIIKKNSLYFKEETEKLLNDYIFLLSEISASMSLSIKNLKDFSEYESIISQSSGSMAKKEALRDKIKIALKKELGDF